MNKAEEYFKDLQEGQEEIEFKSIYKNVIYSKFPFVNKKRFNDYQILFGSSPRWFMMAFMESVNRASIKAVRYRIKKEYDLDFFTGTYKEDENIELTFKYGLHFLFPDSDPVTILRLGVDFKSSLDEDLLKKRHGGIIYASEEEHPLIYQKSDDRQLENITNSIFQKIYEIRFQKDQ